MSSLESHYSPNLQGNFNTSMVIINYLILNYEQTKSFLNEYPFVTNMFELKIYSRNIKAYTKIVAQQL